jgi:hypothetical protein
MDFDPAGDCWCCDLVLHEKTWRDNGFGRGWSDPNGNRNDRRADNNRHN